jgi:hypothetical protein
MSYRPRPVVVTLATNPIAQQALRNWDKYQAYVAACEAENLEHHDVHMWVMLAEPEGPLG